MGAIILDGGRNDGLPQAGATDPGEMTALGFRLEEWAVDPDLNRLSRDGTAIRVEPKVMDVLVQLATHAGKVVPKERLIHAVWGREYLAESVLTRAVAELRRVLADDAHAPRYIETIPKRGYRLIAPVTPLAANPMGVAAAGPRHGGGWLVAAGFALGAAMGWFSVRVVRDRVAAPRGR